MGLKINEDKTKFMEVTMNQTNTKCISASKYKSEKVTAFKYLGT